MKVSTSVVRDNSLVYSQLLQNLRQHAEIRRMFVWHNGMQQLHFCSQWGEELGVVPDRLDRIRQVSMKKRMVVTSIEPTGIQTIDSNQQAAAIYRGFADASVLELHLLLSDDPAKMKSQVTQLELTMQPIADAVSGDNAPTQPSPEERRDSPASGNGVTLKQAIETQMSAAKPTQQVAAPQPASLARTSQEFFEHQHGLVDFFSNVNASLDRKETAFNVVNELRRETDADRVSLIAFAQQGRGKLLATSGVAKVNRKGRETIQLEKLVTQICQQNQTFSYPTQDFLEIPIQFRKRIEQYLVNSSARSLLVVPVTSQRPDDYASETDAVERDRKAKQPSRTIAAIVIESFQSSEHKPEVQRYHETLAHCGGDAYRNAFLHQRAFLFPLWEFLGKQYDFFIGRYFSRTATALCLAAMAMACMCLFQGNYRLSCDGKLVPADLRTIWAEIDGIVDQVHVQTAQAVEAGDLLMSLENNDLTIQQQEYAGNLFSLRQRLESVDRLLAADAGNGSETEDDAQQMSIERTSLVQQVSTTKQQLQIIEQQLAGQKIKSPIAGTVLTADMQKELQGRPVTQGTALLDVADINGDWVLELKLPDRKVGELLKAQQETDQPLKVSFVRSSEPSVSHEGTVRSIDLSSRIDDEVGQFLRIVVDIDSAQIPGKNVGMEAVAYVQCGRKSYAYIWTKEIADFVNKHIIFPLF